MRSHREDLLSDGGLVWAVKVHVKAGGFDLNQPSLMLSSGEFDGMECSKLPLWKLEGLQDSGSSFLEDATRAASR